ncbi:MAG: helix-turn-helix domain-containing protein, partial [Thermoanaerobaculia bacterium]
MSRWEKGLRAPQRADAARLRTWLGKDTGTVVDVFDLRSRLGMTQRVFGAQFGVSRQQVQKWESGKAAPRRSQLDKLVSLAGAAATVATPLARSLPRMLTVSGAVESSGITEKTIRNAIKNGRLAYTVDTSPGPWPRSGRYLIQPDDLETYRVTGYDPHFKKGRCANRSGGPIATGATLAFPKSGERT